MNKEEKIKLGMVIGIYLAIAILLFLTIFLVKNVNEIKTDPILYGIEKMNYDSCACYSPGVVINYKPINTLTNKISVGFDRNGTERS